VTDGRLGVFGDVNVLIDAFVFQHGDDQPLTFEATEFTYTGNPTVVFMMLVQSGDLVNEQRVVLHTSERCITLMTAKLIDNYRWSPEAARLAAIRVINLVKSSGGTVCRNADVGGVQSDFGIGDQEDQHRLAEARRCEAAIFLTNDTDLLDLGMTDPLVMTPRAFIDRSRT